MASLFMTVSEALTPSLRGLVAESLDEPPDGVERAARSLAGGVVAGLITVAGTPSGAAGVLRAVRRMDVGVLFDASPLLDSDWRDGKGQSLLGPRADSLADAASASAGVRPESARALLEVVEPLVLAAIARSGVASDEAGLRSYLRSVEPEATRLAPTAPAGPARRAAQPAGAVEPSTLLRTPAPSRSAGSATGRRVMWVLIGLVLIALVLLFTVGRD